MSTHPQTIAVLNNLCLKAASFPVPIDAGSLFKLGDCFTDETSGTPAGGFGPYIDSTLPLPFSDASVEANGLCVKVNADGFLFGNLCGAGAKDGLANLGDTYFKVDASGFVKACSGAGSGCSKVSFSQLRKPTVSASTTVTVYTTTTIKPPAPTFTVTKCSKTQRFTVTDTTTSIFTATTTELLTTTVFSPNSTCIPGPTLRSRGPPATEVTTTTMPVTTTTTAGVATVTITRTLIVDPLPITTTFTKCRTTTTEHTTSTFKTTTTTVVPITTTVTITRSLTPCTPTPTTIVTRR